MEGQKILHYKYVCKKTGKVAFVPYWSTGFLGNFVGCDVSNDKPTKEPCKSCDLEATREDAGFR